MTTITFKSIYVIGLPHANIVVKYPNASAATGITLDLTPVISLVDDGTITSLSGSINMTSCDYLANISLPLLSIINGDIIISASATGLAPITSLAFPSLNIGQRINSLSLQNLDRLTSLNMPTLLGTLGDILLDSLGLTSISFPTMTDANTITLSNLPALTVTDLPQFNATNAVSYLNLPSLISVSFPQLSFCTTFQVVNCRSVFFVDLPGAFYAACNQITLFGLALPQAQVDGVLHACVVGGLANGMLELGGGTSATPSGAGAADAATLIGNGWTVHTN